MRHEDVRRGASVRVGANHKIAQRRGMVGKVVGRYGGEKYVALDVRFPDGEQRLFHPSDLIEEKPAAGKSATRTSWWRSLVTSA